MEEALSQCTKDDYILTLLQSVSEIKTTLNYVKEQIQQIQIDSISGDKEVKEFVEERSKYATTRQDGLKAELSGQIAVLKKQTELQEEINKTVNQRLEVLENKEKNKVYSRWEAVKDKVFILILSMIFAAIFKYINFVPPNPL